MKEYYIYLTILHHPTLGDLYYAGKHKSEGPEKDKKYHGSCRYVHWEKWIKTYPVQTRILQWFDTVEEESAAETDLIIKCLTKHGAFLQDIWLSDGAHRSWLDQFGKGSCLNGHWGDGLQMRTSTSQQKRMQTSKENGSFQRFIEAAQTDEVKERRRQTQEETGALIRWQQAGIEAAQTDEVKERRRQTQEETGVFVRWQQAGIEAARAPEVRAKACATRTANGNDSDMKQCHTPEADAKSLQTRIENGSCSKGGKRAAEVHRQNGTGLNDPKIRLKAYAKFCWYYKGTNILVYVGRPKDANEWQQKLGQIWDQGDVCDKYVLRDIFFFTNGHDVLSYRSVKCKVYKGKTVWTDWSFVEFDKNFKLIDDYNL